MSSNLTDRLELGHEAVESFEEHSVLDVDFILETPSLIDTGCIHTETNLSKTAVGPTQVFTCPLKGLIH